MATLTNSKDSMHCLQRQNRSSEKYNVFGEILTCNLSIYTMDHPDKTVSNLMENSIGSKRVKGGFRIYVMNIKILCAGQYFAYICFKHSLW